MLRGGHNKIERLSSDHFTWSSGLLASLLEIYIVLCVLIHAANPGGCVTSCATWHTDITHNDNGTAISLLYICFNMHCQCCRTMASRTVSVERRWTWVWESCNIWHMPSRYYLWLATRCGLLLLQKCDGWICRLLFPPLTGVFSLLFDAHRSRNMARCLSNTHPVVVMPCAYSVGGMHVSWDEF